MATAIAKDALPRSETAYRFEGERYGEVGVSFFLTDAPPGSGPKLHMHPYAEVFVVQEGHVTFTVGAETIPASAGQIVIVPPNTPHTFVNAGPGRARHIDIHTSRCMETEWARRLTPRCGLAATTGDREAPRCRTSRRIGALRPSARTSRRQLPFRNMSRSVALRRLRRAAGAQSGLIRRNVP